MRTDSAVFRQLGIIGCGLMGGSFALAMRRAGLVRKVVGYSKSPSTTEQARALGVIDVAAPSALQAVTGSDIVLLSVPVAATEATLKAISHAVDPAVLYMDVGSTKADVVMAARKALGPKIGSFVPAHPIAGKEVSGVHNAEATLYEGAPVILTPLRETDPQMVARATELWTRLGAKVLTLEPEAHDTSFAAVSHLPHLLAFAYFSAVAGQPGGDDFMALAGPGFRDFTRIAGGDPEMWRDVLLANADAVLEQSALFRTHLDALEFALRSRNADALHNLIRSASEGRRNWRQRSTK